MSVSTYIQGAIAILVMLAMLGGIFIIIRVSIKDREREQRE